MDIRQLLEQLSKLSKEPLQEQAQSNVRQLPLKVTPKGKIDPGTQAMNQMGVVLTKPGEQPADQPATTTPPKSAATPGQRNLFALPKLEPETPAMMPKQPWLDPKGAKEPAFMRKAAGNAPAEPLGMIGGTGPDAKFAKAAAANEPAKLTQPAAVTKLKTAPRVKVGTGSEYANVYGSARGARGAPSFADTQYAKEVSAQLQKYPDDPNLRAEHELLKQQGIIPATSPNATPLTRAQLDVINQNDRAAAAASGAQAQQPADSQTPGRPGQLAVPDASATTREPTYYQLPSGDWIERLHRVTPGGIPGAVKEYASKKVAEDFENYLDANFPVKARKLKEQGLPGLLRRLIPRGKPKAPELPPTVTPQKPVQMPKDVETPAYIRKSGKTEQPEPSVAPTVKPEPAPTAPVSKPGDAANAPTITQPKVFKQNPERAAAQASQRDKDLMQTRPGADGKPIMPPKPEPLVPTPAPGKPGSVTKQRRKLIPPAAASALSTPGGGGKEGDSAKTTEPTPSVELWRPEDLPSTTTPADIPIQSASVPNIATPSTSTVTTKPEPTQKPTEPAQKPAAKPKDEPTTKPETSSGTGGGERGGQGTGTGTGTGPGTAPGDSSDWIERLHKVTPGGIPGAVKEFKEFINDFKVPYDKRKIK